MKSNNRLDRMRTRHAMLVSCGKHNEATRMQRLIADATYKELQQQAELNIRRAEQNMRSFKKLNASILFVLSGTAFGIVLGLLADYLAWSM